MLVYEITLPCYIHVGKMVKQKLKKKHGTVRGKKQIILATSRNNYPW